jgi:hypothetical protein
MQSVPFGWVNVANATDLSNMFSDRVLSSPDVSGVKIMVMGRADQADRAKDPRSKDTINPIAPTPSTILQRHLQL